MPFKVLKDTHYNTFRAITSLKIPRLSNFPKNLGITGNPGFAGNLFFNSGDQVFYGHDGISWVPIGGGVADHVWEYSPDTTTGIDLLRPDPAFLGAPASADFLVATPLADASTEGAGTKIMFDASKGAIRAGTVTGSQWNDTSRGIASVAFGRNTTASAIYSTISGGEANVANDQYTSVSGGYGNTASGRYSTVSGGQRNTATEKVSTVSGGYQNTSSDYYSTVSGGYHNTASDNSSTVSGGYQNTASGDRTTVSGGYKNTASGYASTVSGGDKNTASGNYSWAGGRSAMDGGLANCFVFGGVNIPTTAVAADTFVIGTKGPAGANTGNIPIHIPHAVLATAAGLSSTKYLPIRIGVTEFKILLYNAST